MTSVECIDLYGTVPSSLVLADGLAMSHRFLSEEKLQAATEDMYFAIDVKNFERQNELSARYQKQLQGWTKDFADPSTVERLRGVLWLEAAVAEALETDAPLAPGLVYALWGAATANLELQVTPL
jgi:hypothetical protein